MIKLVKFRDATQIGPESAVETYLEQGQVLLGFKMSIEFDKDERFLLLTGNHIEAGRKPFYQLVPLSAVSTLMMDHRGVPASTTAKKA